MVRVASPDLIDAARLPHRALRRAELYLKRQMFAVENAAVLRLLALYAAAFNDLRTAGLDLAARDGFSSSSSRYVAGMWRDSFLLYAETRVQQLRDDVWHVSLRALAAALSGAYYGRLWQVDMATREDVPVRVPMLRASDVLDGLTEDAYGELIVSLIGREWRAQYALEMDELTLQIRRAVGQGLTHREDERAIMRRVSQAMGVEIDRRRGARGSAERQSYRNNFARIQTLTRTLVNRVSAAAAVEAYKLNPDIVLGMQWLTTRDEAVCPRCAALNGTTYDFDDVHLPPEHPNCRCTLVPRISVELLQSEQGVLRTVFDKWTAQLGVDQALADFMHPTEMK